MDDNYLQNHQFTTIQEAEYLIDNSQETDITISPTVEITETIKDLEITVEITMMELTVVIEITIAEAEIIVTTEIMVITDIIRPNSRYTNRSNSRQNLPFSRNNHQYNNNNINNNKQSGQRHNSRDSNGYRRFDD